MAAGARSVLLPLLVCVTLRMTCAYQEVHELDVLTYQKVADGPWLIKFCACRAAFP